LIVQEPEGLSINHSQSFLYLSTYINLVSLTFQK